MAEVAEALAHPDNEQSLLAALRAGSDGAFEQLVREYGRAMLGACLRILGDENDAHDALQEAFLSAFKAIDQFDGRSKLGTWLHRIAINAALLKLRTQKRKRETSIDQLLPKFSADGHMIEPASSWPDAEHAVSRSETRRLVRSTIEQLPASYREVLVLRDIEGLDTDETARALGETPGNVKTRLHRARQALRTLLDPHLRGGAL